MCGTGLPYLSDVRKRTFNDKTCAILGYFFNLCMYLTLTERPSHKTFRVINGKVRKMRKFSVGLKNCAKNSKNGPKWPKLRQIVVFL